MNIKSVYANIELISTVFNTLILERNYSKKSDEISWLDYKPGIFKNLYAKEYEQVVRNRQYSFLLKDNKGAIQFFYLFDGSILRMAKLCYYPYPVELREKDEDIENYLYDHNDEIIGEYYYDLYSLLNHQFELSFTDNALKQLVNEAKSVGNFENEESIILRKFEDKYKITNSSHFRIDYDANVKSHHKCEIQIGAINEIRTPMERLIMPFTFCDFIFKNVIPDKYKILNRKSHYQPILLQSKKDSYLVPKFSEGNIFSSHI